MSLKLIFFFFFLAGDIISLTALSNNSNFISLTSSVMAPELGFLIVISRLFYKQVPLKPMESGFSTYFSILVP